MPSLYLLKFIIMVMIVAEVFCRMLNCVRMTVKVQ